MCDRFQDVAEEGFEPPTKGYESDGCPSVAVRTGPGIQAAKITVCCYSAAGLRHGSLQNCVLAGGGGADTPPHSEAGSS